MTGKKVLVVYWLSWYYKRESFLQKMVQIWQNCASFVTNRHFCSSKNSNISYHSIFFTYYLISLVKHKWPWERSLSVENTAVKRRKMQLTVRNLFLHIFKSCPVGPDWSLCLAKISNLFILFICIIFYLWSPVKIQ